ncbi:ectoine/hydroxyectoine ABC transporter substrate-binding protein EhuB [Streptomyces sp. IBSBF 2953]|uniref:ectoine/hydroxyectoine ABC transporter substrate-binding protein EhuB n=1 Tax=Streptomyces TaxID=1883 RepID=UPI00211A326A|nr:ectoine/hydroxyectoine ABC transporter substrate-binding protein EhuB [Streptomyces scabiei]MCQ9183825.1 ectoine/hydroxyectoine ABC transporter substrate-binding protein EhuB [Streptomyces hayashii]MDX3116292.1 ectoine/hydroxyectoine ABC transporter substrate-binding protein EhuB [Streptomyces scabiei]
MARPHANRSETVNRSPRGLSRRSLFAGAVSLGIAGSLGAAGCSRVPGDGKVLGGSLLDVLRDQGSVKIGIASEPPIGYVGDDGQATGEAPAIAKAIFKKLGIDDVKPVPVDFAALIPGLKARQFDVVSAGMYINPVRCEQVLFADPDYLMLDAFIVKKGNPHGIRTYDDVKKKGLKLATGKAAAQTDYAKAAGIGDVLVLPDQVAGLDAVTQGRVDAFAATRITVKSAVAGSRRVSATEPFQPVVDGKPAYGAGGFAFRQSERNLRDAFNAELLKLKRDDYRELLEIVGPFGFTKDDMTGLTAKELCG